VILVAARSRTADNRSFVLKLDNNCHEWGKSVKEQDKMTGILIVCSFLLSGSSATIASPQSSSIPEGKLGFRRTHGRLISAFASAVQISRLPVQEQKKRVPEIYKLLRPELTRQQVLADPGSDAESSAWIWEKRNAYSPSELVDRLITKRDYECCFYSYGQKACDEVLRNCPEEFTEQVSSDLKSSNTEIMKRGLKVITELGYCKEMQTCVPRLYRDIACILANNPALKDSAAGALESVGDPRAIPILVDSDRSNPMKFFELLRTLSRSRPADQSIVKQLDSKDPEIRWRAAYALAESGDATLMSKVKELVNDPNARVRMEAGCIPMSFGEGDYKAARSLVLTLLTDRDKTVRIEIAACLASKKDTACAPCLLGLLRDETLDQMTNSRILSSIHDLTGSYFGYSSVAWKPDTPNNKAAIKRYEDWLTKNRSHAK
jgi:hypothetical protein